ncbi:MAG: cobalamin-binding protein [Rhodothermales bacterium]
MSLSYPRRIVCLTEETTEWLYLLGEAHRIVGISAYTCRPPEAKAEKPVVSAYVGGSVTKIKALEPDLVIGFSDVQAAFAQTLIRENLNVLITNQRTLAEILDTLLLVGRIVGAAERAETLVQSYRERLDAARNASTGQPRPRVYFEEWHDPMISAIEWVSELIELAGGTNIFADRAHGRASAERHVTSEEVIARRPDIYIGCWCGKPVDMEQVRQRPGYGDIPAIRHNQMFEMDPAIILQPGPAAFTDGFETLHRIINASDLDVAEARVD